MTLLLRLILNVSNVVVFLVSLSRDERFPCRLLSNSMMSVLSGLLFHVYIDDIADHTDGIGRLTKLTGHG
jgi:hypothetical protein